MAHVATPDQLTYSFPITKVETAANGDVFVWGKATDGTIDSDDQIVDPEWSAKALEKWLTTGANVRVMHSAKHLPAGIGVEVDTTGSDGHWVRSEVVEPTAKLLVQKKVLQAYSVGISNPKIIRDTRAKGGRIVGGDIHELSLVDRPANKNCGITLVKRATSGVAEELEELFGSYDTELVKAAAPVDEEPAEDASQSADDEPDGDDDPDDEPDDEPDELEKAYAAAVAAHQAAEPTLDASAGPRFLAKRAEWQRWDADGEENGLDGTTTGYQLWLTKQATPGAAEEGEPAAEAVKGAKSCQKCGKGYDGDAKKRRCEGCNAKLPKVKADKGAHREPDGSDVEALERDAGMPTTPDTEPDEASTSVKSASYQVQRMHDAVCAAFPWDTVTEAYPALKSVADAVTLDYFRDEVAEHVAKGDMPGVALYATLAAAAEDLAKGAYDPAAVADERASLHKGFADLHPGSGVSPGHITPGQFQRPYVSAGHAPLAATGRRALNIPAASHTIDPDDFDRQLITAGHQAESPSDMGDNLAAPNLGSGAARTYYRTASREAARMAMRAMHDHIAETFPDMCPMAASMSVLPPDMGDKNRPHRAVVPDSAKAPGEKAHPEPDLRKVAKTRRKIVKAAVRKAVAEQEKVFKSQIEALQAEIEELGAQPDPAQAPLRGVVRKANSGEPAPQERVSLVEQAQRDAAEQERQAEIAFARKFLDHADPAKREWAEDELTRLQATP